MLAAVGIAAAATVCIAALFAHWKQQLRYNEAMELMKNGEYMKALVIFHRLEGFSDSLEMAAAAENGMLYDAALDRMAEKDYAGAGEILERLNGFRDAEELLSVCGSHINYEKAKELMEKGEYSEAAERLADVDETIFPDTAGLLAECENEPLYQQALESCREERYYDAYLAFTDLGPYKDSAERALSCILEKPSTGEMYRSSEFRGADCELSIVSRGDGSSTFFKIYDALEAAEVSRIFIRDGETATILLPAGEYLFKDAYGYGDWFGETDVFGDKGVYERLLSGDASEIFTLQTYHEYTLFLEATAATGGEPVETGPETRQGF